MHLDFHKSKDRRFFRNSCNSSGSAFRLSGKEHEAIDLSAVLSFGQKFPQNRLEFLVRFVSRQNE